MTNQEANILKKLHEDRNKKHYDWLKNIILMASGLLGILVSLHSVKSQNCIVHYSFSLSVFLLGIGILTSSIYLYAEVDVYNHHLKLFYEYLKNENKQKTISHNEEAQEALVQFAGIKPFYVLMKYVAFVSLGLSVLSLIVYAILMDIN